MIRNLLIATLLILTYGCQDQQNQIPDPVTNNIVPTANAGANQIVSEQTLITLNGSGEDTDGEITNFSWSQVSGPNVTLNNADMPDASFTSPSVTSTTELILRLTVTDNENGTSYDDVIITVVSQNINNPPIVNDDIYSTNQGQQLIISAPGVLANDNDAELDPLEVLLVEAPTNGALTLAADGAFTYMPETGFVGQDTFLYRANDGANNSTTATVTINVTQQTEPVSWNENDFATVYDVGPGQTLTTPADVPWETLAPNTLIRIHWRQEPYRTKWAINTAGTLEQPVVVLGIPNGNLLPVISGENATTRTQLSYWNEQRSIIKIGGSNLPDNDTASYIYIENLDIQSARPAYSFTDSNNNSNTYSTNAAAIHIESGSFITIRNSRIHDVGNGLFAGSSSSNIIVNGNHIYDNGEVGSGFNHNSYTEVRNITFEYNYFGPLRNGAGGENIKDRSSGTIIRYNWIESGNRQLDLVESDYTSITEEPAYANTYVYGNVMIENEGDGNGNMIHFGGDGGNESLYRSGILHFYHNTIITNRTDQTGLFGISINSALVDIRNNIFYASGGGNNLGISTGRGQFELRNNWLPQGWHYSSGIFLGSISEQNNIVGTNPDFVDLVNEDFHLVAGSNAIGAGDALSQNTVNNEVTRQYVKHQNGEVRPIKQNPDIGAFYFPE